MAEVRIGNLIDMVIPVDTETAWLLSSPARREAIGRYLGSLLSGQGRVSVLVEAIAGTKQETGATSLTDAEIDAELKLWRAESKP